MEEITETWRRFSNLSKWAGGLGCSWTAIRGAGAHIHGTNGESSGVIPFLKVSNDIAVAVNQGGKRPGALCSYLELWHSDIEDFLDLRKETGDDRRRTHNMNTAHWIPDLFMKRLKAISDGVLPKTATWTLFRTSDVRDLPDLYGRAFEERYEEYERLAEAGQIWSRQVRVLALWKRMLETLFETGHPWLAWKDPANIRNPQDHAGIIHNSNLCTEIQLNTSSDEVAVCNLASVNLAAHLRADGSLDHERLRDTVTVVMRMLDNVVDINFYPVEAAASANLHHPLDTLDLLEQERGLPVLVDRTARFDWEVLRQRIRQQGMRNCNCLAIAPTWILQCAAVRQKWVDQAQSTNLWLADPDARSASFMYREAWERGLKTTYYLRTLNKSGIDSAHRDRYPVADQSELTTQAACSIESARSGVVCEACQSARAVGASWSVASLCTRPW